MGEPQIHIPEGPWRLQAYPVVALPAPKYVMKIWIVGQCEVLALIDI